MVLLKCCTWYASKFGKFSSVHRKLKKVSFHSNPKESHCQECSNNHTIALISQASKLMLKILQSLLQQYMNHELPVQAGFSKSRGTRDQMSTICWSIQKAREFQKNIYFFIDYAKAFNCVHHNKLWKILRDENTPYLSPEKPV